jgi:hypothetical protein
LLVGAQGYRIWNESPARRSRIPLRFMTGYGLCLSSAIALGQSAGHLWLLLTQQAIRLFVGVG